MYFTDSHGTAVALPPNEPVSWRVSGYALIQDTQGRHLMVQSGNGLGHFPGGGIEEAGTIPEGIGREIQEETGYQLNSEGQTLFTLREQ